jgi:hypothetical protein
MIAVAQSCDSSRVSLVSGDSMAVAACGRSKSLLIKEFQTSAEFWLGTEPQKTAVATGVRFRALALLYLRSTWTRRSVSKAVPDPSLNHWHGFCIILCSSFPFFTSNSPEALFAILRAGGQSFLFSVKLPIGDDT